MYLSKRCLMMFRAGRLMFRELILPPIEDRAGMLALAETRRLVYMRDDIIKLLCEVPEWCDILTIGPSYDWVIKYSSEARLASRTEFIDYWWPNGRVQIDGEWYHMKLVIMFVTIGDYTEQWLRMH